MMNVRSTMKIDFANDARQGFKLNFLIGALLFNAAPSFSIASAPSPLVNNDICLFLLRNQKIENDVLKNIHATADVLRGTEKFLSPIAWRTRTASFGLPGLDLPTTVGGRGYSAVQMTQVFEQMGRLSLDMRDMVGGAHVRPLLQSESLEIRAIVQKVALGKAYVAIAITEKEAGSDIRAMKSVSEQVKGGYLLTGDKLFNARLETATHVILFARSSVQNSATTKLNAYILPKDYLGLHFSPLASHGLYGNSFGGVSFSRMFVPNRFRIGAEGEGGKIFRDHFLYWRLMMTATAIGTGKNALEQAAQRMRTRQAFGGPIGRFTHLQQELAEHTTKLHAASLLVHHAALLIDQGATSYEQAMPLVAMAKSEGVEWALAAADFAMQVFGAEGYSPDLTDLGQRVRDLQGLRIADGTTHVMRQEVVKHTYGADFWDMAVKVGATALNINTPTRLEDFPSGAFDRLRNEKLTHPNALVSQQRYDWMVLPKGGGACPTVATALLAQGIGIMSGVAPLIDLDKAIKAAYESNPSLVQGRLTNEQVAGLLEFYRKEFMPQVQFKIQIDYQRALQTGSQPEYARGWTDLDSGLFQVNSHEMKLISYTVSDSNGNILGRHFVVLKERSKNTIVVVDPAHPSKNHVFELSRINLSPNGNQLGSSFQLIRPGSPKHDADTFTVNSVFTVALGK